MLCNSTECLRYGLKKNLLRIRASSVAELMFFFSSGNFSAVTCFCTASLFHYYFFPLWTPVWSFSFYTSHPLFSLIFYLHISLYHILNDFFIFVFQFINLPYSRIDLSFSVIVFTDSMHPRIIVGWFMHTHLQWLSMWTPLKVCVHFQLFSD